MTQGTRQRPDMMRGVKRRCLTAYTTASTPNRQGARATAIDDERQAAKTQKATIIQFVFIRERCIAWIPYKNRPGKITLANIALPCHIRNSKKLDDV